MRLLHVSHQYRPAVGGAEQYITNLSEEMAARGHQVTVLTSRSRDYRTWRSELASCESLAGVEIRRFSALTRGKATWRILKYGYRKYWMRRTRRYEQLILIGNGPVCPGLFGAVLREARHYDLVHINNLHYAHAATAYAAAHWRHVPVVLTPHIHVEQPATYDVEYMRGMLRGSDHILADTAAERQALIAAGLDYQRVTTAGVGLRLEDFPALDPAACRRELGIPHDAFVLLFLGRKTEYKGLDTTLEAFSALQALRGHLYLLAIGPETDYSRGLWSQYAGMPRLLVRGDVDDEIRLKALNACDCLVMPSAGEAFGIVYLEAWAVGKPVVAARTKAVSSLIDAGQDGYLVTPGDARELAECIDSLVRDPPVAQSLGWRGQLKVQQRYSLQRIGDIVEGVYWRVLRRRAVPAAAAGHRRLPAQRNE
jgi:glycosyltransferase involved in cell wall biosynthesis